MRLAQLVQVAEPQGPGLRAHWAWAAGPGKLELAADLPVLALSPQGLPQRVLILRGLPGRVLALRILLLPQQVLPRWARLLKRLVGLGLWLAQRRQRVESAQRLIRD